jgi:hypothetical protein
MSQRCLKEAFLIFAKFYESFLLWGKVLFEFPSLTEDWGLEHIFDVKHVLFCFVLFFCFFFSSLV